MSRRGFTLVELVVSLAILGLAMQVVLPAAAAWRRQTALRKATSDVAWLFRRASLESRRRFLPYRVEFDAARRMLTGSRSELEAGQGASRWVADRTVQLDGPVRATRPENNTVWIVDRGCPGADAELPDGSAAGMGCRLEVSAAGLTLGQSVSLDPCGAVRLGAIERSGE